MYKSIILLFAVLNFAIVGCTGSTKPYKYRNEKDEMPGPGLFSGEEGGFVIYNEDGNKAEGDEKTPENSKAD